MAKAPKKKLKEEAPQQVPIAHYPMHMSCVDIRIIEKLALMEHQMKELLINNAYLTEIVEELRDCILEEAEEEDEKLEDDDNGENEEDDTESDDK
jgi:hypothetical protein